MKNQKTYIYIDHIQAPSKDSWNQNRYFTFVLHRGGIVIELFVQQMAIALYKIASPSVGQSVPK